MKDRISTYPGRIKLTKEGSETSEYYFMEMADNPTEPGTPLDKAHLLTDTTAAEFLARLGSTPDTIDSAFRILNSKILRIKTGTFTGSCPQTQDIMNSSGGTVQTWQSISGIGFEPLILVLSNIGGSIADPSFTGVPGYAYTAILVKDETSYEILRPSPSTSWYDVHNHMTGTVTADVEQRGMESISWNGDTVSWSGQYFYDGIWDQSGESYAGRRYRLSDSFNLSGNTYRYIAIGL